MNLCSQLRSITFIVAILILEPKLDNDALWNAVVDYLLMIPSTLRRVIINANVYGDVDSVFENFSERVDWKRLEGALELHRSLETVILRITREHPSTAPPYGESERLINLVESRLARVSARGILQFTAPV